MKRVLRSIVFILLSAVVFTFAAAWCCAWWRPAPGGQQQMSSMWKEPNGNIWEGPALRGLGWTEITLYGAQGFTAYGYDIAEWLPDWINAPTSGRVDERAVLCISAGWPARCLRARLPGRGDYSTGPGGVYHSGRGPQRVHWGIWEQATILDDSARNANNYRVLPYGVLAWGFVLNLLCWSLPGVIVALLFSLRRFVRHKRTLCSECGYPVGESDVCTECGVPHYRRFVASKTDLTP